MSATNWAGNVRWSAARAASPTSVDELRALVAGSERVRAAGTGHSFSTVADTTGTLLALDRMPRTIELDPGTRSVAVSAAVRFGELGPALHDRGWALRTLGSLPHIAVAGAVATGTHGSGDGHGTIAAEVRRLELVTADGGLLTVDRDADADRFAGFPVALGCLGVVVRLVLDVVPTYQLAQQVFEGLPWGEALDDLDAVLGAGYSVSLFTRWDPSVIDQVWVKQLVGRPPAGREWGARAADGPRHPVAGDDPAACTDQLGRPGPWHERLPHFRLDHVPSHGAELQSEYLVDRRDAPAALRSVLAVADRVRPALLVSEIRSVGADDLWLSPAYGRDSVAVHFTWRPDPAAVADAVEAVESALAPYGPRPHWGKVFSTRPDTLEQLYPRYEDMRALIAELDPRGAFRNDFVDRHLPRR